LRWIGKSSLASTATQAVKIHHLTACRPSFFDNFRTRWRVIWDALPGSIASFAGSASPAATAATVVSAVFAGTGWGARWWRSLHGATLANDRPIRIDHTDTGSLGTRAHSSL
jgi:hypothetical protein